MTLLGYCTHRAICLFDHKLVVYKLFNSLKEATLMPHLYQPQAGMATVDKQ